LRRLALVALFLVLSTAANAETLVGQASVIDGDTVEIHGQRIRLHGIDAPESSQLCLRGPERYRCGQAAAFALADRIGEATVTCEGRERDRWGRLIAVCRARGEDLNGWLVRAGWALAFRRYAEDYVPAETEAQRAGYGMWAGVFVPPWDWRRGVRLADLPEPAAGG
jgi:endonuclease YncB( thermonuclease family)